jgi:hypothetical protein
MYSNNNLFFKDIITGTQINGTGVVKTGYDTSTGIGSPLAPAFVNGLSK